MLQELGFSLARCCAQRRKTVLAQLIQLFNFQYNWITLVQLHQNEYFNTHISREQCAHAYHESGLGGDSRNSTGFLAGRVAKETREKILGQQQSQTAA